MKILVTGVGGQLGHDVMNELNKRGYIWNSFRRRICFEGWNKTEFV